MPKATVKMQQTQPLAPTAVPAMAKVTDRPMIAAAEESGGTDGLTTVLSLLAFLASAGAAALCYLAYTAVNNL